MGKKRADVVLVERGLFDSRAKARAAIEAGGVSIAGRPLAKPSELIDEGAVIEAVAAQEGYEVARSAGSPEQAATGGLTFAFPTTGWEENTRGNLEAMLASKGKLIARALCTAVVPVGFEADQAIFPWFADTPEPEVVEATTVLLTAMIKAASKAKRVSAKPPAGSNDKYAMRCFLLRLGFIGDQYKTARKVLTRNLDGNAAWANPPAPQAPEAVGATA